MVANDIFYIKWKCFMTFEEKVRNVRVKVYSKRIEKKTCIPKNTIIK